MRVSSFVCRGLLCSGLALAGCNNQRTRGGGTDDPDGSATARDLAVSGNRDLGGSDLLSTNHDASTAIDSSAPSDFAPARDFAPSPAMDLSPIVDLSPMAKDLSSPGIVTGGPCASGAPGAAAFRIAWTNANGNAQVQYEVYGLPDKGNYKAAAYGYQFGFTPMFVDMFLAQGGLQLDGSDFVDMTFSTVGVANIQSATLSILGRSYSVGTNGSFSWQTGKGVGATAQDFVSNVPPYQWYSANITNVLDAGNGGLLLRIKAGPSSGALVARKIEICMQAQ